MLTPLAFDATVTSLFLPLLSGKPVVLLPEGRQFEILAQNKMEESISSSPAISGGRIYLRTFNALYAVGK